MLDNSDKKWIEETIYERLDRRFAEHDKHLEETLDRRFAEHDKHLEETLDRRFAEYDKRMNKILDERFAEHDQRLNKVMDERFADAIESFERRINERFDSFEARFMLMMENEIAPLLRIHAEVIPDTYKSYRNLEDRVEVLEQNYDVLKNVISTRL